RCGDCTRKTQRRARGWSPAIAAGYAGRKRPRATSMKWLTQAACALSLSWCASGALAETFAVGFYDYPPMMIEDGRRGIYQDIFDELARLTGDRFDVQYYPYPRIGLLFDEGKLDIEPGVYPGWMQSQTTPGIFSVPFGKVV